jgi:excisionase family DNA binding protein
MSTTAPRDPQLRSLASVMLAREQQSRSLLGQKFYRITEVAAALSVHAATVRKWVATGQIRAVRTGHGRWRISEQTLRELQGKGTV